MVINVAVKAVGGKSQRGVVQFTEASVYRTSPTAPTAAAFENTV